ncbi:hypothetical protein HK096_002038, partial [Nowakowskiella sp. JEL0078]
MNEELEKEVKKRLRSEKLTQKALEKQLKPTRFLWSDSGILEMLAMVRELKHAHDEVEKVTPGFVAWTSFYDKHICKRKLAYPELMNLEDSMIQNKFKALCAIVKRVRDLCEGTGGGGLHDQLEAEGVSLH